MNNATGLPGPYAFFFFFHKKANLKHTTVKLAINAILKTPVAAGDTIHISVS